MNKSQQLPGILVINIHGFPEKNLPQIFPLQIETLDTYTN